MKPRAQHIIAGIALANLMSLLLIFASTYPFTDSKIISQALTRGLVSGFVIPLIILLISGRWWLYHPKLFRVITTSASFLLILSGLILTIDLLRWNDWIGAPPLVQLGQYMVYGYHWPMIYFGVSVFVLFCNIMPIKLTEKKKIKNVILWLIISVFGMIWIQIFLYSYIGFIIVVIEQTIINGVFLIYYYINNKYPLESNQDLTHTDKISNKIHTIIFDLGKIIFIMAFFAGIGFENQWIIGLVIEKPNFIPLWLEFIPMIVIGGIFWILCYHWRPNRLFWMIIATLIQIGAAIFLALDPYAADIYRQSIMWCSAFSFPGIVIGLYLHLNVIESGLFRKILLRIGSFTAFTFGFGYGVLYDTSRYDPNTWIIGIPVLSFFIGCIFLGQFFTRGKFIIGIQKSVSETCLTTEKNQAHDSSENLPSKRSLKATVIFALMIGLLCIIPSTEGYFLQSSQQEHVLGTPNQDYYLWTTNNLRTIGKDYEPNFKGVEINNTVRVVVARGEHEGFQVILTPAKLKNLNVWSFFPVNDLQESTTGAKIGKGNITISMITYVPQLREQYPDRLYPFQRVDTAINLFGQKNWPFYIDIEIPRDSNIQAGIYTTQMKMHCEDYRSSPPDVPHSYHNRDVTFNVEVEVLNFSISLERHIGTEIIWHIPDTPDWVDFYHHYRLDPYYPLTPVSSYNADPTNLSITFNFTKWENDLQYCFARGMRYFPVTWQPPGVNYTEGYNSAYEMLMRWYISNITTFLTGKKTPWNVPYLECAYFFVIDEPPPAYYNVITQVARLIHSISPSLKIMETMNNDLSTYPRDFLEEVDIYCQYIHHWIPSVSYPADPSVKPVGWPTTLKTFVDSWTGPRQKTLWVYLTRNRFPTPDTDIYMSGIMQRNSFWLFWTYQITGWLYWSFNWGMDMDGGYGYAGFGESTLVGFGQEDKPLSSLRLERLRDGIEDFEYFWLLNATISRFKTDGREADVLYAKALLHQVDQIFNQANYLTTSAGLDPNDDGYLWAFEPHYKPYLDLRLAIGREIARLNS